MKPGRNPMNKTYKQGQDHQNQSPSCFFIGKLKHNTFSFIF
jgi:hypothetical protein